MLVRFHRRREWGAPILDLTPIEKWPAGFLEFSDAPSLLVKRGKRRLVLRALMSDRNKGVLCELFDPRIVSINSHSDTPYITIRGVEPVKLRGGETAAVVQEWLVVFAAPRPGSTAL